MNGGVYLQGLKNFFTSIILAIVIFILSSLFMQMLFPGDGAEIVIAEITIISTLIFCTLTIVDTIKKYSKK